MSETTSTVASATSSAAGHTLKAPANLKIVGVILAVVSGLLIGSSFVFKKKGLLRSQAGGELGEGVEYLKSPLWWTGMIMMILGEICNFAAYAFVEAIVVTPLGALSVVVCAILSSIFLNEKLSFFGWLGCGLCILGSIIIALNGPKEETIGQIRDFQKLFLAPGFLSFISVLIVGSVVIVFYFAPKYGKKSMFWYISVCSMIGGISVSVTTGLGAAIVTTAMGDSQFKHWFMYFLFGFVIVTLLVEVYYLNVALALFNTAMVTPTYYVIFTFCTMVTTIVLFQGLAATVPQILTIVLSFLVICLGITILQMSKVDPSKLSKLDRRSTLLLQAAREHTDDVDEKGHTGLEDPGMDALRGSFGTVGSIIRARTIRRMSQSSHRDVRLRPPGAAAPYTGTPSWMSTDGLSRHQLYDAPVPRDDASSIAPSVLSPGASNLAGKRPTIKFDDQDLVHQYNRPGQGENTALHNHRQALAASMIVSDGYPPVPSNRATVASDMDLLEMDSPDLSRALATPTQEQVTGLPKIEVTEERPGVFSIPALRKSDLEVHSAPPSVFNRFTRVPGPGGPAPMRKDSRDIFDQQGGLQTGSTQGPSPIRGTLLSFPSVTDSQPSEWDDESGESGESASRSSRTAKPGDTDGKREKSKERRVKQYPGAEDDEEASKSLWMKATQRDSMDSMDDESLKGLEGGGGIRLVPTISRDKST